MRHAVRALALRDEESTRLVWGSRSSSPCRESRASSGLSRDISLCFGWGWLTLLLGRHRGGTMMGTATPSPDKPDSTPLSDKPERTPSAKNHATAGIKP